MKPCEWCGTPTARKIVLEVAKKNVTQNKGTARIKMPRTVPCCDACRNRLKRVEEPKDVEQGKQLDVYEVIELIEKGKA